MPGQKISDILLAMGTIGEEKDGLKILPKYNVGSLMDYNCATFAEKTLNALDYIVSGWKVRPLAIGGSLASGAFTGAISGSFAGPAGAAIGAGVGLLGAAAVNLAVNTVKITAASRPESVINSILDIYKKSCKRWA